MRTVISIFLFLFLSNMLYSVTSIEINEIMEKDVVTVEDGLYLISALNNPGISRAEIFDSERAKKFQKDAEKNLDYGTLGIMIIEYHNFTPALMYSITGWGRYAFYSMVEHDIFSRLYSWVKTVSGEELVAIARRVKQMKGYGVSDTEEDEELDDDETPGEEG